MLAGADVQVSDTLLSDDLKGALIEAVNWMPMYFVNRWERFRSHELDMHWHYPVAYESDSIDKDVEPQLAALDAPLRPIEQCWQAIKAAYPYPVTLYECTVSANAFGTEGRIHHDVDEDFRASHRTALVFCNREWKTEWAGETLVIDGEGEISAAVLPKPGRVMRIAGDPQHVGRSVSRTCPTDRRVLVYKFWGRAAT
jgi:SM-20-related protein